MLKRDSQYAPNVFIDCGDYTEMVLFGKDNRESGRTKISSHQVERVKTLKWNLCHPSGYPVVMCKGQRLSRFLINAPSSTVVDHINQDTLDNRDENLRATDRSVNGFNMKQHSHNSTGVNGVVWHKASSKWWARIGCKGKTIHLGLFNNFDDAVRARKQAEEQYFGKKAQ